MATRSKRSALQNLFLAIAATVALIGGYYLGNLYSGKKPELETATVIPGARLISDFALIDFNNQPFTLDNFRDKWSIVFFGYTYCPDICPAAMNTMVEVNKALKDKPDLLEQLQTVFISVDPERDTPEKLKEYTQFFHPDFLAATGPDEQLRALTKQLALNYRLQKPDEKGNYLVDHSAWLIVINPDGQFHAVISGAHYDKPAAIAKDIAIITDFD